MQPTIVLLIFTLAHGVLQVSSQYEEQSTADTSSSEEIDKLRSQYEEETSSDSSGPFDTRLLIVKKQIAKAKAAKAIAKGKVVKGAIKLKAIDKAKDAVKKPKSKAKDKVKDAAKLAALEIAKIAILGPGLAGALTVGSTLLISAFPILVTFFGGQQEIIYYYYYVDEFGNPI